MVDILKCLGQCPRLMQASAILMMLNKHASFLTMVFQWRHVILSGPGAEESAHLLIADKNSYVEKGLQFWDGFWVTSWRISTLTWRWSAVLKMLWSAFHRSSGVRQTFNTVILASKYHNLQFIYFHYKTLQLFGPICIKLHSYLYMFSLSIFKLHKILTLLYRVFFYSI